MDVCSCIGRVRAVEFTFKNSPVHHHIGTGAVHNSHLKSYDASESTCSFTIIIRCSWETSEISNVRIH